MRLLRFALFAVVAIAASPSRADLIVPEVEDCRGKQVGEACPGGTCESDGFSCRAGSCQRFGTFDECERGGCRWVEGLSCHVKAPPTAPAPAPSAATAPPAPVPPPAPAPAGCNGTAGALPWSGLLVAALLGRRRRPMRDG